jgi:hypothetical protein
VVLNVDLDGFDASDSLADLRDGRGIGLRPLEETTVAAEYLRPAIPAEPAERVVGEDDRVVGQAWIGDDHRHPRGAYRRDERIGPDILRDQFGRDTLGIRRHFRGASGGAINCVSQGRLPVGCRVKIDI